MARVTQSRLPRQATRETQELANAHKQLTRQINTHPFFQNGEPRVLEAQALPGAGNIVLRHGLGRVAKRWLVLHSDGTPALTFVSADANTLTLASTSACTADIMVL